jgi:hypothetical protein
VPTCRDPLPPAAYRSLRIHPTGAGADMIHTLDMYALLLRSITGVTLPVDAGSFIK